ncbi:hypothetical protein G7Z17_g11151 [Cylindrodendrum hubeiense]|uniref:Uncharacterized protein n=1 Tax=Cylindrodendrum hubeiense TaxID=595255 RepID=A0A9P5L6M6_9HYPO|nr:hypothetical protein G7Z17_g11151 [Cylindrodendrum hubeiense]
MVSIKGRPLPARVEKTDTSVSSTDESFEDNKLVPTSSEREHLDEHHSTSKFIEAMKNPDWRRRREDNTSSTSTQSGFGTSESSGFKQQMELEGLCSKSISSGHQKLGRFGPWDHIASSQWRSNHEGSEADIEPMDISASDDTEKVTILPEQWGLCGLVKQRELADYRPNGKPMSIIELVPFCTGEGPKGLSDGTHDASFSNIAHIQRIDRDSRPFCKTPRKTPRNEQERELAAVLAATEATPPRMHIMPSKCQFQSQLRLESSSATPKPENTRGIVLDKPAIVPPHDARHTSMATNKLDRAEDSHHDSPDLKKKHAAFQKMLDKLHKGASQITKVP